MLWIITNKRKADFDEADDGQGCERHYGGQSEEIAGSSVNLTTC